MIRSPKRIVREWIEEVWNSRHLSAVDEFMATDALVQVEGVESSLGPDDFKAYRRSFGEAVPDLTVTIHSVVAEDVTAILHWAASGTHLGPGLGVAPSGRHVWFTGLTAFEFDGGRIVGGFDRWNRGELVARLTVVQVDELRSRTGLSRREAEVAALMADRFTHREIAAQLSVTPNTARRHCEKVLTKLGLRRRQEVAGVLRVPARGALPRHGADLRPGDRGRQPVP
jgi:steroid delta-isomerase-like uncharacterized protein